MCGNMEGLLQFVIPMRSLTSRPLVLLHPQPGEGWEWDQLMDTPNVFYCKGSAMEVDHLVKAGARTAEVVVILVDQKGHYASLDFRAPDSFGIFVANAIDEYFDNCRWVLEIVEESSLSQLECLPENRNEPYGLWPRFVSGMVYMSSSLDGLLAQCFYNNDLLGIVSKLVGGLAENSKSEEKENSLIGMLNIPDSYIGKCYGELFEDLSMNYGVIALGLYREPEVYNPAPPLPVVLANPDPQTPLYQSDRVYVLRGRFDPAVDDEDQGERELHQGTRKVVRLPDGSTRTLVDHATMLGERDLLPGPTPEAETSRVPETEGQVTASTEKAAEGSQVSSDAAPVAFLDKDAPEEREEAPDKDGPSKQAPAQAGSTAASRDASEEGVPIVGHTLEGHGAPPTAPVPARPSLAVDLSALEQGLEDFNVHEVESWNAHVAVPTPPLPPPLPTTPIRKTGQALAKPQEDVPTMAPLPPPTPNRKEQ